MSFNAGNLKWGDPTLGESSGTITWSADYLDGLKIAGGFSETQVDAALVAAFDAWESIAQIDFERVDSGGDVTVVNGDIGGAAGTAYFKSYSTPTINVLYEGKITFSENLTWSPYGGGGGVDFYAVAAHEVGHILGLGHVDDRSEIMNPVIYADDLGDGDIYGAQYLYGTGDGEPLSEPPAEELSSSGGDAITSSDPVADDGGSGGAIGMLLGLIAAIVGLVLGGGSGAAIALAGEVPDDDGAADGHDEDSADTEDGHAHDVYHHSQFGDDFQLSELFTVEPNEDDIPDWDDQDQPDGDLLFPI